MVKKVLSYVLLLVIINILINVFIVVSNEIPNEYYHPFFPIGGERQLQHYAAVIIPILLPVIWGSLLGLPYIIKEKVMKGNWRFNWYLFIIIVLPLLLLPLPTALVHLQFSAIPLLNIVSKLFPIPHSQFDLNIGQMIGILAGFLFMFCFRKNIPVLVQTN